MKITTVTFVKSSASLSQCPPSDKPEYAFAGRSNVGKSSLINMLCGRKSLAKTSSTPGKTQLINHFSINEQWYLVDLPGYGWAKVSRKLKAAWGVMIEDYLLKRENLTCLFVLLDARLPPQTIDYDFIEWLGTKGIPFALVFTKRDKLSAGKFAVLKNKHLDRLQDDWEENPMMFESSSVKSLGKMELLRFIDDINKKEFT